MIFPKVTQNQHDVSNHYDNLDPFYREFWGEHLHHGLWISGKESSDQAVVQLLEHLVEKLNLKKGNQICDVGCGYGATSRMLVERWGAIVTGMTISKEQFLYANGLQRDFDNPEFI